ncbi:carboxynorspermidine decarboxylase [Croceicoccus sp. F390]|uniref:Carboxynorspermidine/carboxyspermidine decarboxylase n=1 Tax=Croceicoccus esteveae TaxID=3075597 RepID=A0ABU2ZGD7_9SPHN|nr:carboxynorspermidine decarboxylase [Croceicoccus sp. F390]MDT0575286.1 carboxynorspermidine decarboxylase [Croceicoccus sp. F390]
METQAGDPGAFARFDLNLVDSPAFVIDAARLRQNLRILADIRDRAGIKVLAALKAFSMWSVAPLIGEYLDGVCTSGIYETLLAAERYDGEIATYCAAYKPGDMDEILRLSDHVIFNTPMQMERASDRIARARSRGEAFDIGLRINPLHAEGEVPRYDPCAQFSRLGFPVDQLREEHMEGVAGLHFHTLCEQDLGPLKRTWDALLPQIEDFIPDLTWLNFGGGHHITRADYQRDELVAFLIDVRNTTGCEIYLEPGEAVALDAGILVGTILDAHWNGMPLAITDISATCHMPDVIEAPYRPAMLGEAAGGEPTRLGGPSCLAGDVIGDYRLPVPAEPGERIAFLDQAHYSMVKTNTFNGVPLPSIWLWDSDTGLLEKIREFGYETFRDRLS